MNKQNVPKILLTIYAIFWIAVAMEPLDRFTWFLENIVIFLSLPLFILSYHKFRLSNRSYILIFIFAILHTAATYYTYSNTPWGDFLSAAMGWERNHYDRIVHFLYGVMMMPVAANILALHLPSKKFFRWLFLFSIIFTIGSVYEVAEFLVGVTTSPEEGLGFLGFQGDIWDTQKDMALQALGAIIGFFLVQKTFPETKRL